MLESVKDKALALANKKYYDSHQIKPRSFLSLADLNWDELWEILRLGMAVKRAPKDFATVLQGKSVGMLFQKTSTRTRCSFDRAAAEMGASATYIDWRSSNFVLADLRDETKVLSRYYDLIMARVNEHETLKTMAESSEVPVINGLCDRHHPCQAIADFLTMLEYFGPDINGLRLTYIGDGNNVCRSLVHGAAILGVDMTLCCPRPYRLEQGELNSTGFDYVDDPREAVRQADVIYTDTWVSMGSEAEMDERLATFTPYQVNADLMGHAQRHALVMHCLPAHPGQEITGDVLRSPRSIVFDQAENRTHGQKALLKWLLSQPENGG